MGIRIQGLVSVAKRLEERLRAGIPPDERDGFLGSARDAVEQVEDILELHQEEEADLPAPSRNALVRLRRVARMAPQTLPLPDTDRPPPVKRVRLGGVVGDLNYLVQEMEGGGPGRSVRPQAECVRATRRRQHRNRLRRRRQPARRAAAALTQRVRHAAVARRAGQHAPYRDQVNAALDAWGTVVNRPVGDGLGSVHFRPGRSGWRRRASDNGAEWRLGVGYLAAKPAEFEAFGRWALGTREERAPAKQVLDELQRSREFGELELEFQFLVDPSPFRAKGQAHDLDALFAKLDQTLLHGSIEKPRLHWDTQTSVRVFGRFIESMDLVRPQPRPGRRPHSVVRGRSGALPRASAQAARVGVRERPAPHPYAGVSR